MCGSTNTEKRRNDFCDVGMGVESLGPYASGQLAWRRPLRAAMNLRATSIVEVKEDPSIES